MTSEFEEAFVHALAALTDASLIRHAQAWASADELEGWDADDVLERLAGIAILA